MIRITSLGQECCRKSEANMRRAEDELTSVLTETERGILISLLQKVRSSFS